ncbi:cell cycle serine/threonine-protein kinase CDC5/MSD2-like [Aplysia californica]|uniref:Cell cycle serine/threonine-protein kinase CDC5/MSD2-like n=1 Tax=Aplysia californica TaxID=6500 RepID=A0ABM0K6B2_APLCA|nr:cell cycle serine/threonine-protein kinase CDC5/MSD2-like [Aplysia californica]
MESVAVPVVRFIAGDFWSSVKMRQVRVLCQKTTTPVQVLEVAMEDDDSVRKVIKRIGLTDRRGRDSWREVFKEISFMGNVSHPHIMKMDWAVRCKGFVAICMPLCSRGSLHDARQSLNSEQIERYFVQIACALRYLHVRCAVHGDVKPGNIFLDNSNNAILGDMGMSRFLAHGQDRVRSWSILGTRGFLAPEIMSDVTADPFLTDAYALGATLWCLVFKRNPRNWEDLLTAVESDSILLPRMGFYRFVLSRLVQNNPRLRLSVCDLLGFLRLRFERFRCLSYTTARNESRGQDAMGQLRAEGLEAKFHPLDITDHNSVITLRDFLHDNYQGLDILVNNAAIVFKIMI